MTGVKKVMKTLFGTEHKEELELLNDPFYYYKQVAFISLVLGILTIVPFMFMELNRTGSFIFLYYGDYNVQQVPFYEHCVEMVHNGDLGWDWYTDLGSNFVGSYSYYMLGSPFFWIMCMFPASWAPYLMGPIYILKYVVASLTAFAFFKRFVRNKNYAVIGALLYSFCGFQMYNIFFNQFHEVVALFPLMLLGMEELVQNDRKGLFAISVALNCMCNYFMFAGQAIFCVLYFFARCSQKSFGITFKKFILLAFEAVLGVMLGAVLFLPAALGVMGNYRLDYAFKTLKDRLLFTKDNGLYIERYGHIIQSFFFPPDIPSRVNFFYGHTTRWASNAAWVPLFGMTGVFAYLKARKKSAIGWLIPVLGVFALVPILNSTFYLFNTNYYARWMYMIVILVVVVTIIALDDKTIDWRFGIGANTAVCLVITAYCGLRWTQSVDHKGVYSLGGEPFALRLWVSVAIALVCMAGLFFLIKRYRGTKKFESILLVSVCTVIVVYGVVHIYCGKEHSSSTTTIVNNAINGEVNIDDDEDFYRTGFFRAEKLSTVTVSRQTVYFDKLDVGSVTWQTAKAGLLAKDDKITVTVDGVGYAETVVSVDADTQAVVTTGKKLPAGLRNYSTATVEKNADTITLTKTSSAITAVWSVTATSSYSKGCTVGFVHDDVRYVESVNEINSTAKTITTTAKNIPLDISVGAAVQALPEKTGSVDYTSIYDNLSLSWKIPTTSCFHSVVPPSVMEFYEKIGITRNVASRPNYNKYGILGFLSLKYSFIPSGSSKHVTSADNATDNSYTYADGMSFTYLENLNNREGNEKVSYKLYENDNFVGMGFWFDTFITQTEFEKISKSNRHAYLCSYLVVPDEEREIFAKYMTEAVSGTPGKGQVKLSKPTGSALAEAYEEDVKILAGRTCDSFEYGSSFFRGEISLEDDNVVMFTVPYEAGWSAKVNGKSVDVHKVAYGFMGVECSGAADGRYVIEFSYATPGFNYGLLITLAGIVILLLYILIANKKGFRPTYRFFLDDYFECERQEYLSHYPSLASANVGAEDKSKKKKRESKKPAEDETYNPLFKDESDS